MRYFVIFGFTLVLVLIILFYNPFLGIYKNNITIEYNYDVEGYKWEYKAKANKLKLISSTENKWVFEPIKNGIEEIDFNYTNNDQVKYHIYYKFFILGNKIFWIDGYGDGLMDYPNPS